MTWQHYLGIALLVLWFCWMVRNIYRDSGRWIDAWFEDHRR